MMMDRTNSEKKVGVSPQTISKYSSVKRFSPGRLSDYYGQPIHAKVSKPSHFRLSDLPVYSKTLTNRSKMASGLSKMVLGGKYYRPGGASPP